MGGPAESWLQDRELIQEFLAESGESLSRLDQELVTLGNHPKDAALLAAIFRTIHTIKGACGFFGFSTMESLAHHTESLLSSLREGRQELTPAVIALISESADCIRNLLVRIEEFGEEGPDRFNDLAARLREPGLEPETSAFTPSLTRRLERSTSESQAMKKSMEPAGTAWNKLPRMVRDVAAKLGKQVRLELRGVATELDKSVVDAVRNPLVHLMRNSCDHGIETPAARLRAGKPAEGRIVLRAFQEAGQVTLEISDDGAGVDLRRIRQRAVDIGILGSEQAEDLSDEDALRLIFAPGLSTAETVTSVSGRGVGMDIVSSSVEGIGGVVKACNTPGKGLTVQIQIPVSG